MEALANYSALLYLEKRRGTHSMEIMLDNYRDSPCWPRTRRARWWTRPGPIVLGTRLETSQEPRAWRAITYGKGSWIMQMLRGRMGDQKFLALLAEISKRYDRKDITTEEFRLLAAEYLPPKSDDPKLESFFEQWVYGTGIPTIKLTWTVKGVAPNVRLTGTVTQSGVDEDFTRRGAGRGYGRQRAYDDAVGAVGRGSDDVHDGAEGGPAEGGAGSALRAVAEIVRPCEAPQCEARPSVSSMRVPSGSVRNAIFNPPSCGTSR